MRHRPRIYLAGPDVFSPDSAAIFERLKALCDRLGLVGVPPSDGDVGSDFHGSDDERAQRIYEGNIRLIREADGVVANLGNFRGLEPDSGTVFELGFAAALGKPVAAYGVPRGSYAERVADDIPCLNDEAGVLRETQSGLMVEGLGQRLNLMLTRSTVIESSPTAALARLAGLKVRAFQLGDEQALWQVYHSAIHQIARRDYTPEQVRAWAPADMDMAAWSARVQAIRPFVVQRANAIVGYADVQPDGYIDHFFVSGSHAGRGIGTVLMDCIHTEALERGIAALSADVSKTAEPFFAHHGFEVVARQTPVRRGVVLQNARMEKTLTR